MKGFRIDSSGEGKQQVRNTGHGGASCVRMAAPARQALMYGPGRVTK